MGDSGENKRGRTSDRKHPMDALSRAIVLAESSEQGLERVFERKPLTDRAIERSLDMFFGQRPKDCPAASARKAGGGAAGEGRQVDPKQVSFIADLLILYFPAMRNYSVQTIESQCETMIEKYGLNVNALALEG